MQKLIAYTFSLVTLVWLLNGCASTMPPYKAKNADAQATDSGLIYQIVKQGTGENAKPGDEVYVHYLGELTDRTEFDNSFKRNQPFHFTLGTGMVIKGWDEGIALLNKGSKAILTIPPQLAYGNKEVGNNIPANSTLIYHVEIVDIKPKGSPSK